MSTQPQSICRICLKENDLKPLKEQHENENIIEMLQTCLSIKIDENDGLPQKICLVCVTELIQAYKFTKKFQTSIINLKEKKPSPVTLIKSVKPDVCEKEFVLPDSTIKDVPRREFFMIDKNIIQKIKDNTGVSPSLGLEAAKLKIINAKTTVVEEIITTTKPLDIKNNTVSNVSSSTPKKSSKKINILSNEPYNKDIKTSKLQLNSVSTSKKVEVIKNKEIPKPKSTTSRKSPKSTPKKSPKSTPKKINILSIESFNKDINTIRENSETSNLQLNSVIVSKKVEVKNKRTSKWNSRNKIYKNRRNKKSKTKPKKLLYSSSKYHEQFEKFLSVEKTVNNEVEPVQQPEQEEISQIVNKENISNNNNIQPIKKTRVSGYVRRFENKKQCPICKKKFRYLEPHLRIHKRKQQKKLNELKKETNAAVKTNELIAEKFYDCKFCDRKFHHKNTLMNHEKMHTNAQNFTCSVCEKNFKEMFSLQRHFNMHTKQNLYECNICNERAYNIKSNLYRHQKVCGVRKQRR